MQTTADRATEPPKKIELLRAHLAAGRWRDALRLANSFARLGAHRTRITRGWEALQRPDFYRQIGRDPDALVEDAFAALRERYGSP